MSKPHYCVCAVPSLIKISFGFSTADSQLLSVPPYVFGGTYLLV